MTEIFQVRNSDGIPFNVRLVRKGEGYGRRGCLVNSGNCLVEFFDARWVNDDNVYGQLISTYDVATIMETQSGVNLYGGVEKWYVTADNIMDIQTFIQGEL